MFDELNFDNLPECNEEAFVEFEKKIRSAYEQNVDNDYRTYSDMNGNYEGNYTPQRTYSMAILAFIDEFDLDLPKIEGVSDSDFQHYFREFQSKISYYAMRYSLRRRIKNNSAGTVITITSEYKLEIGKLLDTIRKIVNLEITDTNKKDIVFSKIASLQSEIDREKTTIDTIFGRMIDLSSTIGECGEKLGPAIPTLDRIKKIFWTFLPKDKLLKAQNEQKFISQKTEDNEEIDGGIL